MEAENKRKREGRFDNKVRLNIPIFVSQDKELDRICIVTGKNKSEAVREAIQIYINELQKAGV